MTYETHYRCTASGLLPGGEIFNWGFALSRGEAGGTDGILAGLIGPNDAVWDDIAADIAAYWSSMQISSRAKLVGFKAAMIGPDGKYVENPVERVYAGGAGIAGAQPGTHPPNQVALAVTTHTAADLGRVKGRWYIPMPAVLLASDGLMSEGDRDSYETQAQTFVNNINNNPGLDVMNLVMCVASQGRRNPDGSQKLAPGNHPVTAVSVGRVLDTQRRRRNKLRELRGTASPVS